WATSASVTSRPWRRPAGNGSVAALPKSLVGIPTSLEELRHAIVERCTGHAGAGWLHEGQRHGRRHAPSPARRGDSGPQRDPALGLLAVAARLLHLYRPGPFRAAGRRLPAAERGRRGGLQGLRRIFPSGAPGSRTPGAGRGNEPSGV